MERNSFNGKKTWILRFFLFLIHAKPRTKPTKIRLFLYRFFLAVFHHEYDQRHDANRFWRLNGQQRQFPNEGKLRLRHRL